MTVDVGEVLARAWQITWKYKVLWVFNMFPVLIGFLFLQILIIPMFFLGPNSLVNQYPGNGASYNSLVIVTDILLAILLTIFYALGAASASLGILRIETGKEQLSFKVLFQDGLDYFGRILGVMLLVGAAIFVVFLLLFGCMMLAGMVPMGLGMLCLQPLLLFIYPALLIVYALIEESQAAVVAENMKVLNAVARGWSLIRSNFWKFVLIAIIIYFGIFIFSSVVAMPLLAPFFFLQIITQNPSMNIDVQSFGWVPMVLSLILLPIFAIIQGLSVTFMKSAYMIVYLRLTRPADLNATVQAATA